MEQLKEIFYMDIYGGLLTKHQQDILRMVLMEDYSLAEIAEELNITRQGVHDSVQRGLTKLQWYEDHLGLYRKYLLRIEKLNDIIEFLGEDSISSELMDLLKEVIDI